MRMAGWGAVMATVSLVACAPPPQDGGAEAMHAGHQEEMADEDVRAMLEGSSTASAQSTPMTWRAARAEAAAGRLPLDEDGIPDTLDTLASKPSEAGHFRVQLREPAGGVQMNRILRYVIEVQDGDGAPVSGATLGFVGGMPLHNHGFPTDPAIGGEIGPGQYPLDGIRFGMKGWWQLVISISSGNVTDTVTFDLAVVP